ncbi:hypothetical protein J6590_023654 [Homalodisca vitripennis]|nr:hypothetical protein J6590_023654 [Homalodisca vitripennis]
MAVTFVTLGHDVSDLAEVFPQGSCSLSVTLNLDMDEADGQVEQICTLLANFSFTPAAADENHSVSAGILFLIGHPQLGHGRGGWPGGTNLHTSCQLQFYSCSSRREPQCFCRDPVPYRWNKSSHFLPTSVFLLEQQTGTTEFPQGFCSLSVTLNSDIDEAVGQVEQICTLLANFSFPPGAADGNHRVSAGILFLIGHPQLRHRRGGWPGGTNLHTSC